TSEGKKSAGPDITSEKGTLVKKTSLKPLRKCRLAEADELKQEGNGLFRLNKWDDALQSYRNGLAQLPERRSCPHFRSDSSSPLERECAQARSVLHGNIAACYVKLGENEKAVKACTEGSLWAL
ncbi:hypothetical protein EI94DRAFT_1720427, partial [Lactarius quietus]